MEIVQNQEAIGHTRGKAGGQNLAAKSLKIYCQKFHPELAIRTLMSDYRKEDWMTNLPLYAIIEIFQLVDQV